MNLLTESNLNSFLGANLSSDVHVTTTGLGSITIGAALDFEGSLVFGSIGLALGDLNVNADAIIGNLTLKAGKIVVAAGNTLTVKGNLVIDAATEIQGRVVVQGEAWFNEACTCGDAAATKAEDFVIEAAAEAHLEAAVTFNSNLWIHGRAYVGTNGAMTAKNNCTIDDDARIWLEDSKTAIFEGYLWLNGQFEGGKGTVECTANDVAQTAASVFIKARQNCSSFVVKSKAWAETSAQAWFYGAVSVTTGATLSAKHAVSVSGDVAVGAASKVVCDANIAVEKGFTLASDSVYAVRVTGNNAAHVVATGAATLAGSLELRGDVQLTTYVTVCEHASYSGSFSAVAAASTSKRQSSEYDTRYADDKTEVGPAGSSSSSTDGAGALIVALSMLLAVLM